MSNSNTMLIVGAGQTGAWAARTLREQGHTGRIVLCGVEPHYPYERPPLSKGLITGTTSTNDIELLSKAEMHTHGIEFLPQLRVEMIDPAARRVQCADGRYITYEKLLLATGGRPFRPLIPGIEHSCVLRSIDDAIALRQAFNARARVAIIGGGWIGLEAAATARALGCEVTIIEAAPRLCSRSVMLPVSTYLQRRHEAAGVTVHLNCCVTGLSRSAAGIETVLSAGPPLEADLVLLAVGMTPNDELAREAGLDCARGVRVDGACRTSDPHIFAAGDVALLAHPRSTQGLRLESWQNAQDQGVAAAQAMLGQDVKYTPIPLLWSEQYDHLIQISGFPGLARRTISKRLSNGGQLFIGQSTEGAAVVAVGIDAGREFRAARKWVEQSAVPPDDNFQVCDTEIEHGVPI